MKLVGMQWLPSLHSSCFSIRFFLLLHPVSSFSIYKFVLLLLFNSIIKVDVGSHTD